MKFGYFANPTNRHNKPFGGLMQDQVDLAQYLDRHDWDSYGIRNTISPMRALR